MTPDRLQGRQYPDRDLPPREDWGCLPALETYFGKPLAQGLSEAGVRRAAEVGCGFIFTRMKQLASLTTSSVPLFPPDDLLAIDPDLYSDDLLPLSLGSFKDRFRRQRLSASELKDKIYVGEIQPFDLLISKGVCSLGWEPPKPGNESESVEKALRIVKDMKDCLNPDNPNALIVLQAQIEDEMLLFSRDHLRSIGLDIVHHEMADDQEWTEIFQEKGVFPKDPNDAGYRLVICKSL